MCHHLLFYILKFFRGFSFNMVLTLFVGGVSLIIVLKLSSFLLNDNSNSLVKLFVCSFIKYFSVKGFNSRYRL